MSQDSKYEAKVVKEFIRNQLTSNIKAVENFIVQRAIGRDPVLVKKVDALKAAGKDVADYIDSRLG